MNDCPLPVAIYPCARWRAVALNSKQAYPPMPENLSRQKIRIALVDDQALVLKGLSALLNGQDGIEIALEASDGLQLLNALPQRPVDVIVSDIRMPGLSGIDMIGRCWLLSRAWPRRIAFASVLVGVTARLGRKWVGKGRRGATTTTSSTTSSTPIERRVLEGFNDDVLLRQCSPGLRIFL